MAAGGATATAPRRAIGEFATGVLCATIAELGQAYAAYDGAVRFTGGGVRPTKLGALLAPYQSEEAARSALLAAGARLDRIEHVAARAGR